MDLNGDGCPEAWITGAILFCCGNTAEAFVLVTKDASGAWKFLDQVGVPKQPTIQHLGWLDIALGGPGSGPFSGVSLRWIEGCSGLVKRRFLSRCRGEYPGFSGSST